MREGLRAAPLVDQRHEIFHLLGDVVEVSHLVVHADEATLGARAVITGDVENQSVVHLTNFFDRSDEATHFVVSLLEKSGKHLCLTDEQTLFIGGQGIPVLYILGLRW